MEDTPEKTGMPGETGTTGMEDATLEDLELRDIGDTLPQNTEFPQSEKKAEQPSAKPTHIADFPYCPARIGRVFDNVPENDDEDAKKIAVPTCGFREVTLKECLECNYPHTLQENMILNGQKLVKNAQEIRDLKSEVATLKADGIAMKEQIKELTSIIKKEQIMSITPP